MRARRSAGRSTSAIAAIPAVVPAPSSVSLPASPLMRRTSIHCSRDPAVMWANATSTPITITLLSTGAYAAATNRRRALRQRGRERGEAVEHHLRQEPQREDRHHVKLRGAFGAGCVERVEARDERREQHRDRRQHREHRHRDGEQRRRGVVVAVLEVSRRTAERAWPRARRRGSARRRCWASSWRGCRCRRGWRARPRTRAPRRAGAR